MADITVTATYKPGEPFYTAPLNSEYLQAKQKLGGDVDLVRATSDGIQNDGSYTHHSTWRGRNA
ncbi:hypothetical protein [Bradyrhizobium sp. BR13661]|jgi:hypothetical protein|uniref:hypothetical protein n=1 Tax=Bradyrhizobium sp. BR13661 TaxID=2940622 RepID=UPI0024737BE3|nr:hypothetical protein [Bradyrhizobium sp. BR13661]MDH6259034.1 hypothetical protein [Bradyrhizobium sp. BR13661]